MNKKITGNRAIRTQLTKGASTVFNIAGNIVSLRTELMYQQNDLLALSSDWSVVGMHFRSVSSRSVSKEKINRSMSSRREQS